MQSLPQLFENNQKWADGVRAEDPDFFKNLEAQQSPKYLWIGCSDSRVPANQITGLKPGEVFVHRNIANVVIQTDLNLLSVCQYAVEHLKVEHIIVCGHYNCGGVAAALGNGKNGLVDNWLRHIKNLARRRQDELMELNDAEKLNLLCELNVQAQAQNLSRTTVIEDAWERGQNLQIHSWIYSLGNGKLSSLADPITGPLDI